MDPKKAFKLIMKAFFDDSTTTGPSHIKAFVKETKIDPAECVKWLGEFGFYVPEGIVKIKRSLKVPLTDEEKKLKF